MKKSLLFSTALTLLVTVGCSNDQGEATKTDSTAKQEVVTKKEITKDVYFKDNELKVNDYKIKITDTKVIPVGEVGNEYSDKPVFAIWYEVTNLNGEDVDPTWSWVESFGVIQDNDPNAVNELESAGLPDDQFLDSQLESIKKGGTVANAVAYELDDLETPVTLIANDGLAGDKLGEQTFNIK